MTGNTESLDSNGNRKSLSNLCARFADKTSMQGVPYIFVAKRRISKILWIILLFLAMGMLVFHLYYLCGNFFSWPKVTKVSLGFKNLVLPAVTVCNVNQFLQSKAYLTSMKLQKLINTTNPFQFQKARNTTQNSPHRRKRFIRDFEDFDASDYSDYDYFDYGETDYMGPKDPHAQLYRTFSNLFYNEPRNTRINVGHDINAMLISCSFNGRTCFGSNFTVFPTKEYGNCYTIQSPYFMVSEAGPNTGLQLTLFMENSEYLAGITEGYGARIHIHEQGTVPYPRDHGIFVSTTSETQIGLKLVEVSRLGQPYGKCNDGKEMKSKYNINYTRPVCKTLCKQENIIKSCGCYGAFDKEVVRLAKLSSKYNPCSGQKEMTCQSTVESSIIKDKSACNCLNPCSDRVYVETISSRQWPTNDYSFTLLEGICQTSLDYCDSLILQSIADRRLNFLKVVVYFEDLNYENLVEQNEIENAQFASDVGGALGLWIGLSVLSIFELVQLCLECCEYGCWKCKHKTEKVQKDKEQPGNFEMSVQKTWSQEPDQYWLPSKTDKSLYLYRGRTT